MSDDDSGSMNKTQAEVKSLKPGKFCIIEGEPCRVVSIDLSKPGKHGAAKARVMAVGLVDGKKREIVKPGDTRIDVPIIEKKKAQVLAVAGKTAQLMDVESFETFDAEIPDEMKARVKQGEELMYWIVLGVKLLQA